MAKTRSRYVLNSRGYWIARYHFEGHARAIERNLISDEKLKAQARTASQQTKLLEQLYIESAPASPDAVKVTQYKSEFTQQVEQFLAFIEAERSAKTLKMYSHVLHQLGSLDEVDQLRVQWLREGKSPSTVNSNLRAISAFENWRVERLNNERIAAGQPLLSARKFKRALEVQKTIKSWDDNALDQMLAYIDDKIHLPPQCVNKSQEQRWELLRRAFFLLKYTGMRGSEVNNLRWSDIKFINGKVFIHLEDHETAAGDQFHVKAKHEEFSLVIFDELIQELQSWEQDHEFILRGYWKSAVELGRAFKTVQEHLALKSDEKPLHAFRAFFCGELFKMGASTEYVRRQMRHRSAVTTARYLDSRNDGMGDHLIELARQFKASKRA